MYVFIYLFIYLCCALPDVGISDEWTPNAGKNKIINSPSSGFLDNHTDEWWTTGKPRPIDGPNECVCERIDGKNGAAGQFERQSRLEKCNKHRPFTT